MQLLSSQVCCLFVMEILREINPEYSLEGLMLKLKLQYLGHLMWTSDSLEKSLLLGNIEGRRKRGLSKDEMAGWHHWCDGHELGQTSGDGEGQGGLVCCTPWGCKESNMNWASEQQQWWKNPIPVAPAGVTDCRVYDWRNTTFLRGNWRYLLHYTILTACSNEGLLLF